MGNNWHAPWTLPRWYTAWVNQLARTQGGGVAELSDSAEYGFARSKRGFSSGVHSWEMRFTRQKGKSIAFGVSRSTVSDFSGWGDSSSSYCMSKDLFLLDTTTGTTLSGEFGSANTIAFDVVSVLSGRNAGFSSAVSTAHGFSFATASLLFEDVMSGWCVLD